ncbi:MULTISPECIES: helix-turn-helix domain-containing protein [unclassified Streptomyces]|uniref:helix-turn-helix domain-containing protein n=1 Tax=unclassified Streptomyces TaxID=2593676 RepID=UPI0022B5ECDE|nr:MULTISPECIES: helix-turn-helix transcriptional regulator [unclassified Streptomyces]MCZ7417766.1 helix-turn-helix transcriptional regulator [Streptomyces sp. WMMC897]MCZ7432438.1 helix-turn-helix transcriptional regulator [Streptomyces sp. WMMC1477]
MPAAKPLDPRASMAAYLGSRVRKRREALGWTQRELGCQVHVTHNRIAQIELATDPPPRALAEAIDLALDADGEITDLWWHMTRETYVDWARAYMEKEARAVKMLTYAAHSVPGLLQTAAYARVSLREGLPNLSEEELDRQVEARIARHLLLEGGDPPFLWAVLDQSALRRVVGEKATMHEQLNYLLEMAQRPNVTLQVLPFEAEQHPVTGGSLTLLSLPDGPDVAYLEGYGCGELVEVPDRVTRYAHAYDLLQVHALPPAASERLIRDTMKEHYA